MRCEHRIIPVPGWVADYAKKSGGTWTRKVIDTAAYRHATIALDGTQSPWVAYQTYEATFRLKVARPSPTGFSIDDVTNPGCCSSTSRIVAGAGGVFLSWNGDYSNNGGDTRAYKYSGSGWDYLGAHGYAGPRFGAGVDAAGKLHVGYDDSYGGIKEVVHDGVKYSSAVIASGIKGAATTLDIEGTHRGVLYCAPSVGVKLARAGSSWTTDTVTSNSSYYCDVSFDPTGRAHVVYKDNVTKNVHYANSGDGYKALTVSPGTFVAIAADKSGGPHIAYSNGGSVYYAR